VASVDSLLSNYREHIGLPWQAGLSFGERTLFAVYNPLDERKLRARIDAFGLATSSAGHGWAMLDVADCFGQWLAEQSKRDEYFRRPEALRPALVRYERDLVEKVNKHVTENTLGPDDVLGVVGAGSLFGLSRVSHFVASVSDLIPGRMLVFFPGTHEGTNYRLFGVGDAWNYLAASISGE
jgi:hypothetical protein